MASGPITSWQRDGDMVGTVSDFIFLGSKITADGDCSHEIKKHLLLGQDVRSRICVFTGPWLSPLILLLAASHTVSGKEHIGGAWISFHPVTPLG